MVSTLKTLRLSLEPLPLITPNGWKLTLLLVLLTGTRSGNNAAIDGEPLGELMQRTL